MPITLGSNISSLHSQNQLAVGERKLSEVYARLSSGQRINKASDDAAGLAIAETLNARGRVFSQGMRNLNDGTSLLNIADNTVESMTTIVTRIRELATQAANGTLSSKQRGALDAEAQQLSKEYFRIVKSTSFNGMKIFDGSVSDVNFQAGYGSASSIGGYVSGQMGNGTISVQASFNVTANAYSASAIADFNGDGIPDVVVASGTNLAVALGNGDGSMRAIVSYSSSSVASDVLAVDVNNDGIADLVSSGTRLGVRIGVGDGTFGALTSYVVSGVGLNIASGDFNGDGKVDLALSGTVVLGNGNGTFGPTLAYSASGGQISVGDLNNDGKLDLVSTGSTTFVVNLGNGDGRFMAAVTYAADENTVNNIELGDLNGDGILDVVTTGYDNSYSDVTVRLGTGTGTFGAMMSFETLNDRYNSDIALADLNGDGILDYAVGGRDNANQTLYVGLGNGNGTFTAPTSVSYVQNGTSTDSVMAADMNLDGVIDIVTVGDSANTGKVFLGGTRSGAAPLLAFSLGTMLDAKYTMSLMDQKLEQLLKQSSSIGAIQSRLSSALQTLGSSVDNYAAAESRIVDIDVAEESAELVKGRVLLEAATGVLSHANQSPAIVLSLLK